MGKKDGTDANGPKGSRTERPHGGRDGWDPAQLHPTAAEQQRRFDEEQAARDAERNQGRGGK